MRSGKIPLPANLGWRKGADVIILWAIGGYLAVFWASADAD
jgi:hypothetical protein